MSPDGRPPAGAGVTYGVDIGGTKVLGIALGPDAGIVTEARVPTPRGNTEVVGSHVAEAVAQVVVELDRALGGAGAAPVGVGAPGMVDRQGRLCFAPNLPQAHGVDWNELIGERLPGRAVLIENDANFAVLARVMLSMPPLIILTPVARMASAEAWRPTSKYTGTLGRTRPPMRR